MCTLSTQGEENEIHGSRIELLVHRPNDENKFIIDKEHAHGIRRYQTAFPQGKMIEEDQFMSDWYQSDISWTNLRDRKMIIQ